MKRLVFLVTLACAIALGTHRADATTCTVPNTFVNGTPSDATQVNANFSALQSCGNSIDHNNIGILGIYATQIIPTSVGQAIFGGMYGYTFEPGVPNQVPLTITGTFLQSADLFDIYSQTGGVKEIWVDAAGILHTLNSPALSGVASLTANNLFTGQNGFTDAGVNGVYVQPSVDNTAALFAVFNATGPTGKALFRVDDVDANDGVAYISKGGSLGVVPAVVTNTGGQQPTTWHEASFSCTLSAGTCTATFSNAAVFASAASYACRVDYTSGSASNWLQVANNSGTQVTVVSGNGSSTQTVSGVCSGA